MQGGAKQQVQDAADFSTPLRSARNDAIRRSARNDGAAGVIASPHAMLGAGSARQSRRIMNWAGAPANLRLMTYDL
ncbi:MAG: hypothetical protein LBF81_07010 [Prevotellaceae bacterium]|nr:hypothetical protein [Prevotellaceae bacterium]